MKKILFVSVMVLSGLLIVAGCSDQSPVDTVSNSQAPAASQFAGIPSNATITSALLWVHTPTLDIHLVHAYKVTAPWNEMTVSWNSFGGATEGSVLASSVFDNVGYFAFDLSSYAPEFLDDSPDYGFLLRLDAEELTPEFVTGREAGLNPAYLEICYTTTDTSDCVTFTTIADAPIYSAMPDGFFGGMPLMSLGPVGGNESTYEILFAFEVPVMRQMMSIGDFVWLDENMDGIQDSNETGLAGVTVVLTSCVVDSLADPLQLTTTTDADGYYLFDSLFFGEYMVQFFAPDGYRFSPQHTTDADHDSDPDPVTGATECFEPFSPTAVLSIDAGMYPEAVDLGCTLGKGYWKNHAGFGPQNDMVSGLLPLTLGSMDVSDAQTAVDLLSQKVYGQSSNGITKLYAHLLAAKLNIANGADDSDIADLVSAADDFLSNYSWEDWDSLGMEDRKQVSYWKGMFEDYNEGEIGPGHCQDHEDCDDGDDGDNDSSGDVDPEPAPAGSSR